MSDKERKIDHSEKRFGVVAVQKGFVTPDELFGALKAQVQDDLEKETHSSSERSCTNKAP
jgi:hypothetical protein